MAGAIEGLAVNGPSPTVIEGVNIAKKRLHIPAIGAKMRSGAPHG